LADVIPGVQVALTPSQKKTKNKKLKLGNSILPIKEQDFEFWML